MAKDHFDNVALQLGHIDITWAHLEHVLDDLIGELARLEPGDVTYSITANTEIRNKIQIAKALGFMRNPKPPADDWFPALLDLLNRTDMTCVSAATSTPTGLGLERQESSLGVFGKQN
jgi:hypothetical protein